MYDWENCRELGESKFCTCHRRDIRECRKVALDEIDRIRMALVLCEKQNETFARDCDKMERERDDYRKALAAERERCAKIAENEACGGGCMHEKCQARRHAAREIRKT